MATAGGLPRGDWGALSIDLCSPRFQGSSGSQVPRFWFRVQDATPYPGTSEPRNPGTAASVQPRHPSAKRLDVFGDAIPFIAVGVLPGVEPEIAFEITEGCWIVVEMVRNEAAVTKIGAEAWSDRKKQLGHGPGVWIRSKLDVGPFQVVEHSPEDLP